MCEKRKQLLHEQWSVLHIEAALKRAEWGQQSRKREICSLSGSTVPGYHLY